MNYNATSGSNPYSDDFYLPNYPSPRLPVELLAFPVTEGDLYSTASESLTGIPASQSSFNFSGIIDVDSFSHQSNYWPTALHSPQLSTSPLSCSGGDGVAEAEIFSIPFDDQLALNNTAIFPLDFPDPHLPMSGSIHDVDWSVLSTDPEVVRWFTETYQKLNQIPTSVHDDDVLMQTDSAPEPSRQQFPDNLPVILQEPDLPTFAAPLSNQSKDPSTLHQPRPLRPIQQKLVDDLATASLRHSKP